MIFQAIKTSPAPYPGPDSRLVDSTIITGAKKKGMVRKHGAQRDDGDFFLGGDIKNQETYSRIIL